MKITDECIEDFWELIDTIESEYDVTSKQFNEILKIVTKNEINYLFESKNETVENFKKIKQIHINNAIKQILKILEDR